MKLTRYITAFCLPFVVLTACETDRDIVTFDSTTATPATLSIDGEAQNLYTLDANNASANVFTLNWSTPEFGVQVPVTNVLQMDFEGQNFSNAQTLVTETDKNNTSYAVIASDLNANIQTLLSKYGMETPTDPANAVKVSFRITSFITSSASDSLFSETLTVNVLPYEGEAIYPEVYAIGDYSGWGWDAAQSLFSFSGDEVNYEGLIDFNGKSANGFKLTGDTNWDNGNWGTDGNAEAPGTEASSVQLINDGSSGNISCYSKRFYHFSFNTSTLVLTMNHGFDQLGICGDLTGWADGNDIVMNFDTESQRFYADIEITSNGGLKFRADGGWDNGYNLGGSNGTLINDGGSSNVPVTAGNYRIYVNLNNSGNMTYELNAEDYGTE